MPASHILLVGFVRAPKEKVSGKTIKSWLSALKAWHDTSHAPWHGDDHWVQMAHITANKEGTAFQKCQHAPVTIEHMSSLQKHLKLTDPLHTVLWATACVAFWGCRCLGELTVKLLRNSDKDYNVLHSATIRHKTHQDGSSSASIPLPWTKTTKEEGGTAVLDAHDNDLCPVAALNNHLFINSNVPADAPLFTPETPDCGWSMMPKHQFMDECRQIWSWEGLQLVDGHSF